MIDAIARDEGGVLRAVLVRYAASALTPDPSAMARIRADLLAQAQHAAEGRRTEASAKAAVPARIALPIRRPFRGWRPHGLSLGLAAALLLGLAVGTSAFAASRPAGPLYSARIWLEGVTLPSDREARLEAEVSRAETRVAEALDAETRDDGNAVEAAVTAYQQIVDETLAADPAGSPGDDRAAQAFAHHREVLITLLDRVPDKAKHAIENAIAQSDKAINRLGSKRNDNGKPAQKPQSQPGDRPAATDHPRQPGKAPPPRPSAAGGPDRSPKPHPTPRANH